MRQSAPRYLQIARDLRKAIAAGRYPVGARLPTEHELCRRLDASRFTVREAIRVLAGAGLVQRKPRAGTVVAALPDDARYSPGISSLPDLFQYAQATHFHYVHIGRIPAAKVPARVTGAERWIYALALRHERRGGKPFGLTRLYLSPALKGIERKLRGEKGPVYSLIEREFDRRIARVEQTIAGTLLDAADAAELGVDAGSAALAIRRAYFDEEDQLVELADTLHAAERFSYRMELRR